MNRRTAIRNSLMALAVSLVPKILRPVVPEVKDIYDGERLPNPYFRDEIGQWKMFESNGNYVFGDLHWYDHTKRKVVFKVANKTQS